MQKIRTEFSHSGTVCQVVLDDGKGNVLDSVMMNNLHVLFKSLHEMKDVKLITFEGGGKHFSFGASVAEHTKEQCGDMLMSFHKLFYELIGLSIPTMAIVSGQCLGGGLELAMFCNFIFVDKAAVLGQPEINLGVFAPLASLILPLKIGTALAEELLLTGNSITAERGREIGLVNEVFESKEEMEAGLEEWIEKNIARKSASSLRFAAKASRLKFNRAIKKDLPRLERMYVGELMATLDASEVINSFLEKRKPEWKNM